MVMFLRRSRACKAFVTGVLCASIFLCSIWLTMHRGAGSNEPNIHVLSRAELQPGTLHRRSLINKYKQSRFDFLSQPESVGHIQTGRLRHLHNVCRHRYTHNNFNFNLIKTITTTISKYDINYCKVPKVGCTVMTQLFEILSNDNSNMSEIFAMSRRSVHRLFKTPNLTLEDAAFHTRPTILLARSPYTRLYSAYVDKIYIPSGANEFVELQTQLHGNDGICGNRPTFQEFLKYVIDTVQNSKFLNQHWAPIHALCKPCETNFKYIIKQETFSDDVEQFMKYLDVPDKVRTNLSRAITTERDVISVSGIIHTTFGFFKEREIHQKCINELEVARLLWESFQIQGYIRLVNKFPVDKFKHYPQLSADVIADVIMEQINNDKLSSEEKRSQRLFYLKIAYKRIPKNIIDEIRKIFRQDFLLFDYDTEPP